MTTQFVTPWKVLAHNVKQYWIGNREISLRNIRKSVSEALDVHPDTLLLYDERDVVVAYLRHQASAIRSRVIARPQDTTTVLINDVADAVDAIAQRVQNGEHIEAMIGDFALSPQDIKRLKRARNGLADGVDPEEEKTE